MSTSALRPEPDRGAPFPAAPPNCPSAGSNEWTRLKEQETEQGMRQLVAEGLARPTAGTCATRAATPAARLRASRGRTDQRPRVHHHGARLSRQPAIGGQHRHEQERSRKRNIVRTSRRPGAGPSPAPVSGRLALEQVVEPLAGTSSSSAEIHHTAVYGLGNWRRISLVMSSAE